MKITFFGTQPYDRESFDRANERYGFEFNYTAATCTATTLRWRRGPMRSVSS